MATAKRKFGSLTQRARQRAVIAGERVGLTREQVRERYNRGTYNPFARKDPLLRFPRELRNTVIEDYDRSGDIVYTVDWHEAARLNYNRLLGPASPKGETYKYNRFTVATNTGEATDEIARIMAFASESELRAWASPQPDAEGNPPDLEAWLGLPPGLTLDDLGFRDHGGSWNNIFWYH